MKKTVLIFTLSIILTTALMFSCGGGGGGGVDNAMKELFTISYNANGAESGIVPAVQQGDEDSPQSVQSNTGNLAKSGYLFDGWNTAANGSGTDYAPGASYKGKDITLYAKWAAIFNVQVLAPASPAPALDGAQMSPGVSYLKILGLTARGRTLSNIVIPEAIDGYQVVSIGVGAFQGCSTVTDFSIPETVTAIEDNAFAGCTGITTLTIPRSVTEIGNGTFSGCGGLSSLVLLNPTPPTMGADALEGCTATVSVPAAGVDAYKTTEGWDTYSASIAGYSTEIYTVTFEDQGATTAPSFTSKDVVPPAVTIGQLPTPPQKTGYNFGGWFKEPLGAGGEFTSSTVVTGNITVYAKWNEYSYTVTFIDQGATTPVGESSKTVASPNTTVGTLPTEPANVGYYFGGWNTKSDGTGTVFNASTPVTGDITVYAIWLNNPTRTVTFNSHGADIRDADPPSKQVISPAVTVGELPTPPAKRGYNFGGWFRNQEGTGDEFTTSTVVTEDITVYAKWNSYSYTVEFDSQGADTPASPTSIIVSSPNTQLRALPLNPTKAGYTFGGWYTSPAGAGTKINEESYIRNNMTVYAKWTAKSYSITYYDEGANAFSGVHGNNHPTKHTYGTETILVAPTKAGFIFDGWYTDKECNSSPVTKLGSTDYTQNIALYAKWTCYLTYEINKYWLGFDNPIFITGLTAEGKGLSSIDIPSEINGNPVVVISGLAFHDCTNITNIIIPNTVREIGYQAFDGCTNLTSVTLPSNLSLLGDSAFRICYSLTNIVLPDSLAYINDGVFSNCESLTNITIPSKVISIGDSAFSGCNALTSIEIPSKVTSISDSAFRLCQRLTNVTVNNGNNAYCSVDGILFNKNMTKLIYYPEGKNDSSYTVPNTVTALGDYAFESCEQLTYVYLPNGLTTIGEHSFGGCINLTEITIPNGVTEIGYWNFIYCSKLSTVKVESLVPPTVNVVPSFRLFEGCGRLEKIIVPVSAVEAYKSADDWSDYANLIVADE